MGAAGKRACLRRVEGGKESCCLGATAEAGSTLWQISEPALTEGIKQLLFPGESEGGRWREETDREGNTERVVVTHLTHRELFSALTS